MKRHQRHKGRRGGRPTRGTGPAAAYRRARGRHLEHKAQDAARGRAAASCAPAAAGSRGRPPTRAASSARTSWRTGSHPTMLCTAGAHAAGLLSSPLAALNPFHHFPRRARGASVAYLVAWCCPHRRPRTPSASSRPQSWPRSRRRGERARSKISASRPQMRARRPHQGGTSRQSLRLRRFVRVLRQARRARRRLARLFQHRRRARFQNLARHRGLGAIQPQRSDDSRLITPHINVDLQ